MACTDCNDVDINTGADGYNGWSPILALVEGTCDGDAVTVHQLVSWQDGSGTRPIYNGNIMTDAWLADHPIYLGSTGFVTDICAATPLNGGSGSAGTPGGTGPEGPEGPPGCAPIADLNFEFTNNGEALTPPVDVVVTVDDTVPCNPVYDISIDASGLFTNPDLINALLITNTFQNYIDSIIATSVGGVNGMTTLNVISDIQKIGNPNVYYYNSVDPGYGVQELQFIPGSSNYFKWNILGNRMTFDFLLNIQTPTNSENDWLLELKIPAGKTVYNAGGNFYPESNAVAITIGAVPYGTDFPLCTSESLQGTPVITTYAATKGDGYLLLGVTPNLGKSLTARPSNELAGFHFRTGESGYSYRIQGQLTFTINT